MKLALSAVANLDVVPLLLWHSAHADGFVAGDERTAYFLSPRNFATPTLLARSRVYDPAFPCVLPLPEELQAEFVDTLWHGLRFLDPAEYDIAVDDKGRRVGDLLRTIHYSPDYGLYVRHPASGLILALKSGSLGLLCRDDSGFKLIDSTRTKGRAALCFAGHPTEQKIAYGDNCGQFHIQEFSRLGFGKAHKAINKERKASAVEFIGSGEELLIGGMGYLSRYRLSGKKWELQSELSIAVRSFCWLSAQRLLFVNHGMHGLSLYLLSESGIEAVDTIKTDVPIEKIAVSARGDLVAASFQHSRQIALIRAA